MQCGLKNLRKEQATSNMLTAIILITINIICMSVGFFAGVFYWDERGRKK